MLIRSVAATEPELSTKRRRSGVSAVTQMDGLVTELPFGSESDCLSLDEWT